MWRNISGWESNFNLKANQGFWNHFVNLRPKSINIPIYRPSMRKKNTVGFVASLARKAVRTVHWRHHRRDGVPIHHPQDCLLHRLFKRTSKKTPKLRVTGLCEGNSPVTGEFPAQRASNAENVSIWWRHHEKNTSPDFIVVKPGNSLNIKILSHQINQSNAHWRVKSIKFKFKFLIHHFIWYKWINWLIKSVNGFVW